MPPSRPSFSGRFWDLFAHFTGIFSHFTGILSPFVPNFPQLWGPRGRRPQLDLKSAPYPDRPNHSYYEKMRKDVCLNLEEKRGALQRSLQPQPLPGRNFVSKAVNDDGKDTAA